MSLMISRLFDTTDFPARWYCGSWSPVHGWLHIISDLGVWSAYMAIPVALVIFARRRTDVPFRNLFWLFSAFILLCGSTHLMEAIIFWWPAYRLAGLLKIATAVVSWLTVLTLLPIIPKALAMRSHEDLMREVREREKSDLARLQSEERYRTVVDGVRDYAIYLLNASGHVTSWNTGAERIKGYTEEEITGKHVSQFYRAEDNAAGQPLNELRQAAELGRFEDEGWRIRKDGSPFWANVVITALRDSNGQLRGYAKVTRDLTDRRKAEEALRLSEERLRLALENANHGLWDWGVQDGTFYLDQRWDKVHGYQPDELPRAFEWWKSSIHPDDFDRVMKTLESHLAGENEMYDVEYRARQKDGGWVWVNSRGRVQNRDKNGQPVRMMGTMHDISERKRAANVLERSVREKEVMLREIHHRVKNNLAVISSLFHLQAGQSTNDHTVIALREAQDRVQTMALVHEYLYNSTDLASVEFHEYAKTLAGQIFQIHQLPSVSVRFESQVVPVKLSVEQAIPCGLILNELLTNCLKHAFKDRDQGVVSFSLEISDRIVRIRITDDGIGIPDGFKEKTAKSLGIRIIRILSQQLDGTVQFQKFGSGTEVLLSFINRTPV